jgi:hypothetical protein
MFQIRYSFKEQVRAVFSNKIKYLDIWIGRLEDSDKIEYFFFWLKITIQKSNSDKAYWNSADNTGGYAHG